MQILTIESGGGRRCEINVDGVEKSTLTTWPTILLFFPLSRAA
jgi:hypothetical protein